MGDAQDVGRREAARILGGDPERGLGGDGDAWLDEQQGDGLGSGWRQGDHMGEWCGGTS
ncbi:hypothetical protein [Nonomuraea basaltis]|uniref:hypothetical protein n=1 Tax=Nonomuraea basaltis TaxID=2495887 RepID=UPI001980CFFC|nr:hypothetical protein [Nonomuraea basaltis]